MGCRLTDLSKLLLWVGIAICQSSWVVTFYLVIPEFLSSSHAVAAIAHPSGSTLTEIAPTSNSALSASSISSSRGLPRRRLGGGAR